MKKLTDSQKEWVILAIALLCSWLVFVSAIVRDNRLAAILAGGYLLYYGVRVYLRYSEAWRHAASDLEWEVYACPEPGRNPFSITEVRYRRLASFGNYENEAVEMAARVWPGEDPDGVLAALKRKVEDKLKEAGVVAQKQEEIFDLDQQIASQRNTLRLATERAEKAKAFLKEHGIELFGDLPF